MFSRLLILATVTFLTASATFSDQMPKYDRVYLVASLTQTVTAKICGMNFSKTSQQLLSAFHKTPAELLEVDGLIPLQTKYSIRAVC